MTLVRLTRAAEADIEKVAAWYEGKRDGLGVQFVERVDQAIQKISETPLGYERIIREVRRVNVSRFPYALWYRVEGDAVVIACLHAKRDPRLAKERARGILKMP